MFSNFASTAKSIPRAELIESSRGMFPKFASTAKSISRATALLTSVGTDAQLYDEPETEDLFALLDSKFEAEKIDGMKRLIALMSQGRDVSNFFPQVVKNVVTLSLELKKLVYIYLVHYAEKRPDEALLAVNTFQRDLSDLNPLVRAWALRCMSGIRVRIVLPLVVLGMNKCSRDPSPYVRRCAAHAIPKVYLLDHDQFIEALEDLIRSLMNDNSPGVIAAVAAAFNVVCPEKLSLWGSRFQKLCELLPNVDEWGQIVLIDILLRYAVGRHGYPRGSLGPLLIKDEDSIQDELTIDKMKSKMDEQPTFMGIQNMGKEDGSPVYSGGRDLDSRISADFWLADSADGIVDSVPQEMELLLQCTLPLLVSHNSGVVMAAAGVHWLLASTENLKKITKPLIFLLRSSVESQYVVLANIATFVKRAPFLFEPYYREFFIRSQDGERIRDSKLDILCLLATESSIQSILEEFQEYLRDPDEEFAAKTVRAIGLCAMHIPTVAEMCTEALMVLTQIGLNHSPNHVFEVAREEEEEFKKEKVTGLRKLTKVAPKTHKTSREALVVTEAVKVLRVIVHEQPAENEEVIVALARCLDRLKVPAARTIVIWMVGEFGGVGNQLPQMVPIILRYLGGTFKKEQDETKLQILNCAVKEVLRSGTSPESLSSRTSLLILDYVLRLAELDLNIDIRDRARWYKGLLAFILHKLPQDGNGDSRGDVSDQLFSLNVQELNMVQDVQGRSDISDQLLSWNVQESSMVLDVQGRDDLAENIHNSTFTKMEEGEGGDKKIVLLKFAERIILSPKPAPILPLLAPERSAFAAGSMSHIVVHRAPNYFPLPDPSSIEAIPPPSLSRGEQFDNLDSSSKGEYSGTVSEGMESDCSTLRSSSSFHKEQNRERHSREAVSSSEDERSGGDKSEILPSVSHGKREQKSRGKKPQNEMGPLINLYDSECEAYPETQQYEVGNLSGEGLSSELHLRSAEELDSWLDSSNPRSEGLTSSSGMPSEEVLASPEMQQYEVGKLSGGGLSSELLLGSATELDSWLDSSDPRREGLPSSSRLPSGCATLSIGKIDAKPRLYTLLDSTNGGGLDVKYCFVDFGPTSMESVLFVKLYFSNQGVEIMSSIAVTHSESVSVSHKIGSSASSGISNQVSFSKQVISPLEPGGTSEGRLSVYFRGSLEPIGLSIHCNGKQHPVQLILAVGALIKPAVLSLEAFSASQACITGPHEALRRCTMIIPTQAEGSFSGEDQILFVARAVAQRVLSNAHVFLVSTIMPISDSVLGVQVIKGSGLQGFCLQFSGETLRGSMLCLIKVRVLIESESSRHGGQLEVVLKINCEDIVLGESLLEELSKALNPSN